MSDPTPAMLAEKVRDTTHHWAGHIPAAVEREFNGIADEIAALKPDTGPTALADAVHIVFNGLPGPVAPRFIECETPDGRSVRAGEWHERADGYCELRIPLRNPVQAAVAPADSAEREAAAKGVYREWCRDPSLCADKGYCPRDPTCGD